jgi:plasmid stabilization system protein ParE
MKEYLITWAPLAEATYLKTLTSILERWTIKEAKDFEYKVESLLSVLKKQKHLCPPSRKMKNLRRCVITPQTSLVYQIRNNYIEIVAFFDNRSLNIYL